MKKSKKEPGKKVYVWWGIIFFLLLIFKFFFENQVLRNIYNIDQLEFNNTNDYTVLWAMNDKRVISTIVIVVSAFILSFYSLYLHFERKNNQYYIMFCTIYGLLFFFFALLMGGVGVNRAF